MHLNGLGSLCVTLLVIVFINVSSAASLTRNKSTLYTSTQRTLSGARFMYSSPLDMLSENTLKETAAPVIPPIEAAKSEGLIFPLNTNKNNQAHDYTTFTVVNTHPNFALDQSVQTQNQSVQLEDPLTKEIQMQIQLKEKQHDQKQDLYLHPESEVNEGKDSENTNKTMNYYQYGYIQPSISRYDSSILDGEFTEEDPYKMEDGSSQTSVANEVTTTSTLPQLVSRLLFALYDAFAYGINFATGSRIFDLDVPFQINSRAVNSIVQFVLNAISLWDKVVNKSVWFSAFG